FLEEPRMLIVAKAAVRARVHRRVHLDYVGVKRFDADGKLIGERRFCGLFTSTAYTRSTRAIPYLRRKVDNVIRRAGFEPSSHSGKALVNVLETYPRDELFQIDEDTLCRGATASTASCRSSSTRRATATTAISGRRSATIWPRPTRAVCAHSIRSFSKAPWCACISSSGAMRAKRRTPSGRRSIARWKKSCAVGPMG